MRSDTAYRAAIVLCATTVGAFNLAAGAAVFAVLAWQLRPTAT